MKEGDLTPWGKNMRTWTSKCDDEHCPGWGWFNESEVQRCDDCDRFPGDEEALMFVVSQAWPSTHPTKFRYRDGELTTSRKE